MLGVVLGEDLLGGSENLQGRQGVPLGLDTTQDLTGEATLDGVGLDEDEDAADVGGACHGGSLVGWHWRDQMDHHGSGRLPAMAGPVKSGLLDDQDRVGGAVAGGIEGGLENECGGLGSGIAVTAGALPQEGGPTTTGLEGLGLLSTLDSGLCGCGEDTDLVLPDLGGLPGGHRDPGAQSSALILQAALDAACDRAPASILVVEQA